MGLERKQCDKGSFYALYPDIEMHSPYRRYGLIVFREEDSEESVLRLIKDWGLEEFAHNESCLIAFPNPPKEGWKATEGYVDFLREVQSKMCEPDDYVFECDSNGIPLLKCMLNRWHLMNDTRYYVGIGVGCEVACQVAKELPIEVAAVLGVDVELITGEQALEEVGIPFMQVKGLTDFASCYKDFMKPIRRMNTGTNGDTAPRMDFDKVKFDAYIEDTRLSDKMAHTWFVHCPEKLKNTGKAPVMIFFHGGSDSPMEAAEMSKFHELGEKEGFITVYPWGSDRASWNCNYTENGFDDVAYVKALIAWLKENYPVDEGRVYVSGFSNGAAMAQIYAMEYPEEIAAVCHIDSNWPGHRLGLAKIEMTDVEAFRRGLLKKETYDYRMPVWYTYGTREPSFPVYKGCSQQLQYDFWKAYNHIPLEVTPELENPHPCGCGVPGTVCEDLYPSAEYPHHRYQVNRFYENGSKENGNLNLYNYVVMHDKGHDVAPMDPVLAWEYVKQFRRKEDGSLMIIGE